MIDRETIYAHLNQLKSTASELSRLKSISLRDYESEISVRWQVERGLQITIQNLLDIGSHLLSALGKNRCETYTEVIDGLAMETIIPEAFADRIRGMAGLRNILVHDYLGVDNRLVHRILQEQLHDFNTFAGYIVHYIERGDPNSTTIG